ncbi:uncharacterized protein LOC112157850 isoform X2 [Oryzias melastigma]|uniref:uncharacterized protein LOC112157850 isoform X2 n=1 Tax=Oryzias melastigma TaxID=30732 RepID=UPI000CF7E9F0|nr:uncharacterized protein LOC112157850 isoform X2 [Oryzias melastigma]
MHVNRVPAHGVFSLFSVFIDTEKCSTSVLTINHFIPTLKQIKHQELRFSKGGNMPTLLEKIENYDARAASALGGLVLRIFRFIDRAFFGLPSRTFGLGIWGLRFIDHSLFCLPSRAFGRGIGGLRVIDQTLLCVPSRTSEFVTWIGHHVCRPLLLIPVVITWIFLRKDDAFDDLQSKFLVKYKMVVGGQTFGAHLQLLDLIKTSGLNLIEINDEERCITFLFCPVTSRIGTDAEAAMKNVKGDDPVIAVLMHYSQEPRHVSSSQIFSGYPNVVLEVQVFYHDRRNGLLRCEQNEKAVNELKEELMKHHRLLS